MVAAFRCVECSVPCCAPHAYQAGAARAAVAERWLCRDCGPKRELTLPRCQVVDCALPWNAVELCPGCGLPHCLVHRAQMLGSPERPGSLEVPVTPLRACGPCHEQSERQGQQTQQAEQQELRRRAAGLTAQARELVPRLAASSLHASRWVEQGRWWGTRTVGSAWKVCSTERVREVGRTGTEQKYTQTVWLFSDGALAVGFLRDGGVWRDRHGNLWPFGEGSLVVALDELAAKAARSSHRGVI